MCSRGSQAILFSHPAGILVVSRRRANTPKYAKKNVIRSKLRHEGCMVQGCSEEVWIA